MILNVRSNVSAQTAADREWVPPHPLPPLPYRRGPRPLRNAAADGRATLHRRARHPSQIGNVDSADQGAVNTHGAQYLRDFPEFSQANLCAVPSRDWLTGKGERPAGPEKDRPHG